jgi:hypothetical protein
MPTDPQTQHEWVVRSINIHGIFFERWCQSVVEEADGWSLDAVNYPVEFPPPNGRWRGKESALDIRASRDLGDQRLSLLVECKKNNPEFVDWIFFQKPGKRSSKKFIVSVVGNTLRDPPARGWTTTSGLQPLTSTFPIADEARETRADYVEHRNSGTKTKTANAAIHDAAHQVSLATQAVIHEDTVLSQRLSDVSTSAQPPWHEKLYFPMIVTTAKLFTCEFDPKEVDPGTGEVAADAVTILPTEAVVFEYPLPRHLQSDPRDIGASYREGRVDEFTRQHIIVVQSRHFPTFLRAFYGSSEVPSGVPSGLPESGPDAAQSGSGAAARDAERP